MTAALAAHGLGRRYGKVWALRECSLELPRGCVAALVGPNGAGKTTLLEIGVGILEQSEGEIRVLGEEVRGQAVSLLRRIGFVAQDAPLYRDFTVEEMLCFGAHLNSRWDAELARGRLRELRIPLERRCGRLSGGQQAQVALTLAVAKRPELLILDEPVARLDPLARREFLESLMQIVADGEVTIVLSSHLISDLERVCDHLVLITEGSVRLVGDTEDLLAEHWVLSGPRRDLEDFGQRLDVVDSRFTERQMTLLVRGPRTVLDPRFTVSGVDLEELVLAYLRQKALPHLSVNPELAATAS